VLISLMARTPQIGIDQQDGERRSVLTGIDGRCRQLLEVVEMAVGVPIACRAAHAESGTDLSSNCGLDRILEVVFGGLIALLALTFSLTACSVKCSGAEDFHLAGLDVGLINDAAHAAVVVDVRMTVNDGESPRGRGSPCALAPSEHQTTNLGVGGSNPSGRAR
jgi:hypothetical protein